MSATSPHLRKPALEFGGEIGILARDMNRLATRFTCYPAVQFLRRCDHITSLAGDWHSRLFPALGDRYWLAQELYEPSDSPCWAARSTVPTPSFISCAIAFQPSPCAPRAG